MCMERVAVHWFKWIKSKIPNMNWEEFAEELVKRYGRRKAANPFEMLVSLRHGDRLTEDYITQFEVIVAQVGGMRENKAMGYFLSGLRAGIHRLIGIHEPKTVMRAMALARNIEESIMGEPLTHILLIQC